MRYNPGCECCCIKQIGQPLDGLGSFSSCCAGEQIITDLNDDISQINDLEIIQVGFATDGTLELFDAAGWPDVADWLDAGGKLIVLGDCLSQVSSADLDTLNDFLVDIGSAMAFGSEDGLCTISGFGSPCDISAGLNNTLPITAGAAGCFGVDTNTVSGGTWICKTNGIDSFGTPTASADCPIGSIFAAGEYIGSGFIFAVGFPTFHSPAPCSSANRSCRVLFNLFRLNANELL